MKDKTLLAVAIILFVLAAAWLLVSYFQITGYAVSKAYINITITPTAAINFTRTTINWGAGSVNAGATSAILDTAGGGTVNGGSWGNQSAGFLLENIGNGNVTLQLASGLSAATLFAGTSPSYKYNVTNNETGSCTAGGGITLAEAYEFNATSPGTQVCSVLGNKLSTNSIRIDVKLTVPSDSYTGQLNDTITATGTLV